MFEYGKVFTTNDMLQMVLEPGDVIIWRDATYPEVWRWKTGSNSPESWIKGTTPLKIIGAREEIEKLLAGRLLPAGSKLININGSCEVQLDTKNKILRFSGKRIKRVLIVDDSGTIRKILKKIISGIEGFEVVGELEDAESIPEALAKYHPDIVTLDLHLKKMNGAEAVKEWLGPRKIPTILISSQPKEDGGLVMDALSQGAFDYLQKPESGHWEEMKEELAVKLEAGIKSNLRSSDKSQRKSLENFKFNPQDFLIVIGSSTGGTQALQEILTRFPEKIPPILIAQHIPAGFSRALAERLDKLCPFSVKEASDGEEITQNKVLIAPGSNHMKLQRGGRRVEVFPGEPVNRFRPSVQVLFESALETRSDLKIISVMLTGMGKDGAEAMLKLHDQGAFCVAQSEESCVVFGMPKEAIRLGAADKVVSLEDIPECLVRFMAEYRK